MTATPISRATQLRYALVRSAQDCNDVYRLRHASYLRNASIDPVPGGGFSDGFDADPNNFSFLVRSATAPPFATVRITVVRPDLGWTDSPAQHMFRDHPALRDISNESFVEASRLCFARPAQRDAFIGLLGNVAALADLFAVEWLVACPRIGHVRTYQNLFGFYALATSRRYFGVKFQTQLLGVRRNQLREHTSHIKPMFTAWTQAIEQPRSGPPIVNVGASP